MAAWIRLRREHQAVHDDAATLERLQAVDAAEERALAAARWSDDRFHRSTRDFHRDFFDDVVGAETLD